MSTEYFTGVCKWAKLREDNMDVYQGKKSWQISIELDGATRKRVRDLKLKNKIREDDEGRFWMNFSRPEIKTFKLTEGPKRLDPPEVVDKDEKPFTDLVGNGSNVTIKVEIYGGTFINKEGEPEPYVGTRLDAVRVNDLVPYEAPVRDETSAAFPALTGKEKKDETINAKEDIVDDELPF